MTPPDLNPYATPTAVTPPPLPVAVDQGKVFRDGRFLLVKDGATLPERCVVTNEALKPKNIKAVMAWTPPWALLIILPALLLGLIPGLLIANIFQKRANIIYTLSSREKWKKTRSELLGLAMALGGILTILLSLFFGLSGIKLGIVLGTGVLLLLGCIGMFFKAPPIKVTKVKNGWFQIKGCSPDFLATLPKADSSLI